MLYREIIAVCSQVHTKHVNTLCGQNVELLNVKLGFKRSCLHGFSAAVKSVAADSNLNPHLQS